MGKNYTVYHLHSDLSNGITNIDSVTKFDEYINYAHSIGMTSIGFSEHGSVFEHIKKRQMCEKLGMKFIHGEEFYLTRTLNEKVKDNYHIVIIAKNYQGYLELNKLSSIAFNRAAVKTIKGEEHYYYVPRITFEELTKISDNLIITTACLGGILHKADIEFKERFIEFLINHKDNCFLEIQHHKNEKQIEYNKYLYNLSQEYGIRLIAGTDTHCLNSTHEMGRKILQMSKNIVFDDEQGWDLNFKTYDELCECYKEQNSLPESVYLEAIDNTNVMSDMVEMYSITNEYKYPHLWENPIEEFKQRINQGYRKRNINSFPNHQEYIKKIRYEVDTYINNGAVDFMLLMTDVINYCNENNIQVGYGRGSANGSVVAWITGITEMDSIRYNLNFERFMNKEKVSLSDIDTDFEAGDREKVKQYLYDREDLQCCDIITFNTIALRGAIRDVCRAFNIPLDEVSKLCDMAESDIEEANKLYPEIMEYVKIVQGTIVSIGVHPCGCVVSDLNIIETFGLCTTSTSKYPVSQIYMKEIDSLNYVKLDLLCLDTIQLINDTCKMIGIPRLTPDNIDSKDDDVWDSIIEDTTMIFQWESDSAQDYIKRLMSKETLDKFKNQGYDVDKMMLFTIGNGAIRPAGASYRDKLANGEIRKSGCESIDKAMSSTFGYCVFQCQIIEFLYKCCGFTMGESDIVRRGFAKKLGTEQFIPLIKNGGYLNDNKKHYIKGFIQTMKDEYGYDESFSEKAIIEFIQVIEDASSYLFSINHSLPYSYEGYISGYLRYYYPHEFLTCALNINVDNREKTIKLYDYAKRHGIKISDIKFRHSQSGYNLNNNIIYKGMSSIKHLNKDVAEKLYELKDVEFDSFLDFLKINPCNSRQTEILIQLDFFSEFGESQYLLNVYRLFQDRYNGNKFKPTIKKINNQYPTDLINKYCTETATQYKIQDEQGFILEVVSSFSREDIPLKQKLKVQLEYLGYITYINNKDINHYYVTETNTKYSPVLTCYKLETGETIKVKISKKMYHEYELSENLIISFTTQQKHKKKLVNGEWMQLEDYDDWIDTLKVCYQHD